MPVLTVPAPLRQRLGEEATDSLVVFINAANDDVRDNVIEVVSERFERRLSEEVRGAETRLSERIAQVEIRLDKRIGDEIAGLRVEITNLDKRLTVEIANSRSELIRWMFGFWIGQIAVIIALFALLR